VAYVLGVVLLISYDLNGHERPSSYQRVADLIERHAIDFKRPLYSQWLVDTTESADTWVDRLRTVIDENDFLLIVQMKRPYQGWLPRPIWDWLNNRI
jgi:hypothetical protein